MHWVTLKAESVDLPGKARGIMQRDKPRIIDIPDLPRTDDRVNEDRKLFGEFVLKASVLAKSEDKFVIVRYADKSEGEWGVPGGLVEPEELIEEAAVREAKEETGFDVRLGRAFAVIRARVTSPGGNSMGYLRLVFQAQVIGGRPDALDKHEIAEVRLATPDEIVGLVSNGHFQLLPRKQNSGVSFESTLMTFLKQPSRFP